MTADVSVSGRGSNPAWPVNKLVAAVRKAAPDADFDEKDPRGGQERAWVTWCPGPTHKPRAAGGGTRELLIGELPSGAATVRCFKGCQTNSVLELLGLDLAELSTGPDRAALNGQHRPEPEDPGEPPAPLPDYPVGLLPGPLADLVTAGVAARIPAELVAGAGLAIASTLVMPAEIWPWRDRPAWWEPSTLWVALVAPAGGGKTPAWKLAYDPLRELEKEHHAAWVAEEAAWQEDREQGEPRPALRRLTCHDVTTEALIDLLAVNGGRMAVVVDELRTWLHAAGRYQHGGGRALDLGHRLSMWAAAPIQLDRKTGREHVRIDHPVVPVLGGIQPELLRDLGPVADGSRPRWLPHYAEQGHLDTEAAELPASWARFVERAYPLDGHRLWHLDDRVRRVWADARTRWGVRARQADTPPEAAAFAAKAGSHMLRVALVAAELLYDGPEERRGGLVPPEAVAFAVGVVDYVGALWVALGGSTEVLAASYRESVYGQAAVEVEAWVARQGGRVTVRDLTRSGVCGIRSAAKARPFLEEYKRIFPGTVRDEKPERGGPTAMAIYSRRLAPYGAPPPSDPSVVGTADNDGSRARIGEDRSAEPQVTIPPEGTTKIEALSATGAADNGLPTTLRSSDSVVCSPDLGEPPESLNLPGISDTEPDRAPATVSHPVQVRETYTATPHLIDTAAGWEAARADVLSATAVGLDIETTGLDPRRNRVCLAQLATRPDAAYVVDLRTLPAVILQDVLTHVPMLAGHHLQFDLAFLAAAGVVLPPDLGSRTKDTLLAAQVVEAGEKHPRGHFTLAAAAERYVGASVDKDAQVSDWAGPLSEQQLAYASADAAVLLPLRERLSAEVDRAELRRVVAIENGCVPAMAWLELTGVGFDTGRLSALSAAATTNLDAARDELDRLMPDRPVNWDSPKQVLDVLRAAGLDLANTAEDTLGGLDHPLAAGVLAYRRAGRLVHMYGDGRFLRYVSPVTGRVHPEYRQLGSVAGRMSCSNPNIQQVPSDPAFRRAFRPAPGNVLIKADYSQIEARIAAAIAGDRQLLDVFAAGEDLHKMTARLVLGRAEVSHADRQAAKVLNFGLLYGMGADRLQRNARASYGVEWSAEQAKEYRTRFFTTYRGLQRWHRRQPDGTVATRTPAGRRRLKATKFTEKLNSPVQGAGADGLKAALGLLFARRDRVPGAAPVLVVHDEIVVEAPQEQAAAAEAWLCAAIVDGMESAVPGVTIRVDSSIRQSWADTEPGPA